MKRSFTCAKQLKLILIPQIAHSGLMIFLNLQAEKRLSSMIILIIMNIIYQNIIWISHDDNLRHRLFQDEEKASGADGEERWNENSACSRGMKPKKGI